MRTRVAPRPPARAAEITEERVLPEGPVAELPEHTPLDRATFEDVRDRARTRLISVRSSTGTEPSARPIPPADQDTPPLHSEPPSRLPPDSDVSTKPIVGPAPEPDDDPVAGDDSASEVRTGTVKIPMAEVEQEHAQQIQARSSTVSQARTGSFPQQHDDQPDAHGGATDERAIGLVADLAAGLEAVVGLLAERLEPGSASVSEHGQLARQIGYELALDEHAVLGAGVAAQLFALDGLLRRDQGEPPVGDLIAVFDIQSGEPGGLNQLLRRVGARCLELDAEYGGHDGDTLSAGVVIVALVRDYLDLRSSDPDSDLETVVQLLRTGGADPLFLDALVRAVEQAEGHGQRTERSELGL